MHANDVPGAWRGPGSTVGEHDAWVLDRLLSVPSDKRTLWWIMGDVAMAIEKLELLRQLPGRMRLVMGNHDLFQTGVYLKYFESVHGMVKRYKMWITHAPLHETELRGFPNIHGHAHHNPLRNDPRYLNVAIDWLPDGLPLELEQVREIFRRREDDLRGLL
jgi:calcineurin-like phosphoesterase family protein